MLQKIASNYLNKEADFKSFMRSLNNRFTTKKGKLDPNDTVHQINSKFIAEAARLRASADAQDWKKTGTLKTINKDFTNKTKCNLLIPQIHHNTMGKTYKSPFRNTQTGRWLSANDIYNLQQVGPTYARAKFNGNYVEVPYDLAPYAHGATIAQSGHVGMVTNNYKTTSAATEKGLIENDWGFRKGNGAHDTHVAYIMPKGIDPTPLLHAAQVRKNFDNMMSKYRPKNIFNE